MKLFNPKEEIVIHDYEEGLFYEGGKFKKILQTGLYEIDKGVREEIVLVDKRTLNLTITGQEILTKDKLNLRLNILAKYKVTDAIKAIHKVENYHNSVYQEVQMSIRGLVSNKDLDELLSNRDIFDDRTLQKLNTSCEDYGVKLESVEIKDIILPGNLRGLFLKEMEAKKNGEIELIKARGEVASTRALINAANLVKDHPEILELKMIESLDKLSKSGNATVIQIPPELFKQTNKKK